MKEKVLAIINEIRATKELSAVSSLNVNDNLRNDLDLTSFDLAELTVPALRMSLILIFLRMVL